MRRKEEVPKLCWFKSHYLVDFVLKFVGAGKVFQVPPETFNISMDGRGRAFDNILTERLWRIIKYEINLSA